MQTQVLFTLLPDNAIDEKAHLIQACIQAAHYYRHNKPVFIFTEDQSQAHEIDELLWAFDADSFIPHNLVGEGPKGGSPVEISWQAPNSRRAVLINLANNVPNFTNQFATVIDFVPAKESLKEQARDRFRTCRQWGFQVDTQAAKNEAQF